MGLILPPGFVDERQARVASKVNDAPTVRTGLLADGWWHRATPAQRFRIRAFVKARLLQDPWATDAEADRLIASLSDEAREALDRHNVERRDGLPDGF